MEQQRQTIKHLCLKIFIQTENSVGRLGNVGCAMTAYRGSGGTSPPFDKLGTRWCVQLHYLTLDSGGNSPWGPVIRGLG
jgi:hypothetical protein